MFSTAIVFDRRKQATRDKEGTLEVRVTIERKSYWISTGVRVLRKHWAGAVVVRPDADALNNRLGIIVRRVNEKVNEYIEARLPIDVAVIRDYIYGGTQTDKNKNGLYDWIDKTIPMLDIEDVTRNRYWLVVDRMKQFGGFNTWQDFTVENVYEWNAWLHKLKAQTKRDEEEKGVSDKTVYNYHKCLKALLHRAVDVGILTSSPYERLKGKFSRGDEDNFEYLTEDQMMLIVNLHPVPGSQMETVRDLFVFQMFTGLAYADMQAFDIRNYHKEGDVWTANGKRIKTGVPYVSVLLAPVVDILERHGMSVPQMPNQKYNSLLKTMGMVIGIDGLHSHLARHTFATYMLSNDVKVQNLMRMLGHRNIQQTMKYANVLARDARNDFNMVSMKLNKKLTIKK